MAHAVSITTLRSFIANRREMIGRETHAPGSDGAKGDIYQEGEIARLEDKVGDWEANVSYASGTKVVGPEPEGGIA